jgi:hypothetical protein
MSRRAPSLQIHYHGEEEMCMKTGPFKKANRSMLSLASGVTGVVIITCGEGDMLEDNFSLNLELFSGQWCLISNFC